MKSNTKLILIVVITLEIVFASAPKITITANNNAINFDNENLGISAVSGKIHIDDKSSSGISAVVIIFLFYEGIVL